MWFGEIAVSEARGCILAHSLQLPGRRLRKGQVLDDALLAELNAAGVERVTVARLDETDSHEDAAALQIASALAGVGIRIDRASTGRVNLFATHDGLLCFDRQAITSVNSVDESITVATLAENSWVLAGKMVATCKIISYGVASRLLEQATAVVAGGIAVQTVTSHSATLIQTRLPTIKDSVLDKTTRVVKDRLAIRNANLLEERRCEHSVEQLAALLESIDTTAADWILIAGASAISDRGDVIPAALEAAGGQITRYGLPVDPGNLLLLGELRGRVVLGLPGCARSPKPNGLDLLLDRLACNVEISTGWLNSLAVGGLLNEMLDRPQPRVETAAKNTSTTAALVLAAGSSRRAGPLNKLTVQAHGVPMVRAVVDAVCASKVQKVVVVTGYQHREIESLLDGSHAAVTYCASHDQGMAHSLSHGISRLTEYDAVLVCLADMPGVSTALINRLIEHCPDGVAEKLVVPVHRGKRGNPVLVGKVFFDSLLQHSGDTGARFLMKQYPDRVVEVAVDDNAIHVDYDTSEALSEWSADN